MYRKITYHDAVINDIFKNQDTKKLIIMIPAHNEENAIGNVLESILKQDKPCDETDIFIALDNCVDNTEQVIQKHSNGLNVFTLETVNNKDRKAGALNQLYQLFFGNKESDQQPIEQIKNINPKIQAFVGLDSDIYLGKDALNILFNEINKEYKIGAVSANYTCLMPEKPSKLPLNTPDRELKLRIGKYSGAFGRFITFCQNMEFSDWTIKQKYHHHIAEINGGQCSMFRLDALKDIYDKQKINGIYSNETDTEDLALTQDLRKLGWKCLISDKARCYVDSMTTYKAFKAQRTKWVSGTIDYMLKSGLSTAYSRTLWLKELGLLLNLIIRILLVILVPSAILLGHFVWNWVWILPVLAASVLNLIIALKTPNHRFIDVLLAFLDISPEIYLWITLRVHVGVWISEFKIDKEDGWAKQYQAEKGISKINWAPILFLLLVILFAGILSYFKIITLNSALGVIKPFVNRGFDILTDLTIVMLIIMIFKLFKFRGNFSAQYIKGIEESRRFIIPLEIENIINSAIKKASLNQADNLPDIDKSLLEGLTEKLPNYDYVAKNNAYLTDKYIDYVNFYGFNSFIDLYTYAISKGKTGIEKTLIKHNQPIEVYIPVNQAVNKSMKKPVQNLSSNRPDNQGKDEPEKPNLDITVSLLGDAFGRVDPSLADKINQVPNSWYRSGEVNGNYDDYLIYNQNNKTIGLVGLTINKTIEIACLAEAVYSDSLENQIVKDLVQLAINQQLDLVINKALFKQTELISLFASNENKKQAKIKVKDLDINAIQ